MKVEEATIPPRGKTPKKLYKIAIEMIVTLLFNRSARIVEQYFTRDLSILQRTLTMTNLLRLKNWYWNETSAWFGTTDSKLRFLLSRALEDGVVDYTFIQKGYESTQMLITFILQLLFGYEAGKLNTSFIYTLQHQCRMKLEFFLRNIGPFSLQSLHHTNLIVGYQKTFSTLLKYTPELKFINLTGHVNASVLKNLRLHCPKLEVIKLEILLERPDDFEDCLCETFFANSNKKQLLERIRTSRTVTLSFANLKDVTIIGFDDKEKTIQSCIMFFLQYFYPGIRTRWLSSTGRHLETINKSGLLYPTFVEESDRFYWDYLVLSNQLPQKMSLETMSLPVYLKAKHLSITCDIDDIVGFPNIVQELLDKFECRSLHLLYTPWAGSSLSEAVGAAGNALKELYLEVTVFKLQDGDQLFLALNQCFNLKVLSLKVDLACQPIRRVLNGLWNLEALSVEFYNHPHRRCYLNGKQNVTNRGRQETENSYVNSEDDEDASCSIQRSSQYGDKAMDIYNRQRYGCCDNGSYKCGDSEHEGYEDGSMEYKYSGNWDDEYGLCIHRINGVKFYSDRLAIFGQDDYQYGNYGTNGAYGFNNDGRPCSASHCYVNDYECRNCKNKHNTEGVIINKSSPMVAVKKIHDYISLYNDGSLTLLMNLISSAYNLKILELPNAEVNDLKNIFQKGNLPKIHTLSISTKFSKEMLKVIKNIQSLSVFRLGKKYGVEEFWKFKKSLRYTSLVVEFDKDKIVYPGSPILENFLSGKKYKNNEWRTFYSLEVLEKYQL